MADKTYNPPNLPPELSRCPQCGGQMVPHGVGNPVEDGTTWRYACTNARRPAKRRTCSYTRSHRVPVRETARPGLAAELREMGAGRVEKPVLRMIAEMVEAATVYENGACVLDALAAALPPGEIPEELKADLLELSNHACAAGLRPEMGLFRALAAQGFGPATVAVVRGFRG